MHNSTLETRFFSPELEPQKHSSTSINENLSDLDQNTGWNICTTASKCRFIKQMGKGLYHATVNTFFFPRYTKTSMLSSGAAFTATSSQREADL